MAAKEPPATDRELQTIIDTQEHQRKILRSHSKTLPFINNAVDDIRRHLEKMEQDVLLHKTIANRMLQAFMSPLKVEEHTADDEIDDDED